MSKVGFIGTGIMGAPMADHLLDGGHDIVAFDVGAVPQALVDKGAVVAASSKEVAEKSDIIIIMVPDTPMWRLSCSAEMAWPRVSLRARPSST